MLKRLAIIAVALLSMAACQKKEVDMGLLARGGGWMEVLGSDSQWASAAYYFDCDGSMMADSPGRLTIIRREASDQVAEPVTEVVDYSLRGNVITLPQGSYNITVLNAGAMHWVSVSGGLEKDFVRIKTQD